MLICKVIFLLIMWGNLVLPRAETPKPSPVHAVVISVPTRAQLDYAAWVGNSLFPPPPVRQSVNSEQLKKTNAGMVEAWRTSLAPGSDDTTQLLSFAALRRETFQYMRWNVLHRLQAELDSLGGGAWHYRRIILKPAHGGLRFWRKPQTQMWLEAISSLPGNPPLWTKVRSSVLQRDSLQVWINWVRNQYSTAVLDSAGVLDWAQVLASHWYPSLNTDLVWDLPKGYWPHSTVEAPVREFLGQRKFKDPTLLIRGNPLGDAHYTLIQIAEMGPVARREGGSGGGANKVADRNLPENFVRNMERWALELKEHGGTWQTWEDSMQVVRSALGQALQSLPPEQMTLEGVHQWLFFRRNLEYLMGGDIAGQKPPFNPLPSLIEFKGILEESEINMLFVPIPTKEEIFPELVSSQLNSLFSGGAPVPLFHPWGRKFLQDAQDEGMEIIDLLPSFLALKQSLHRGVEPLFQKDDTHWTSRGLEIVAQILAERIRQYNWYTSLAPAPEEFTTRDTSFSRLGDLVERLPPHRQVDFPPQELLGVQVLQQGQLYRGGRDAPILLVGDSFTGVYELTDCRHAGLASHLARLTGLDVETITSWGGGPLVRNRVMRNRQDALGPKRLVIYLMTARDLWNYSEGWEPLPRITPPGENP